MKAIQKYLSEGAGYKEENLVNAISELIEQLCLVRVERAKQELSGEWYDGTNGVLREWVQLQDMKG